MSAISPLPASATGSSSRPPWRPGRSRRQRRADPEPIHRLPPAAPGRADFFLLPGRHHVLLVPASSRGAWFLEATPLCEPARLIPRIGPARLLRPDYAAALLPELALHFRLRSCPYPIPPHHQS